MAEDAVVPRRKLSVQDRAALFDRLMVEMLGRPDVGVLIDTLGTGLSVDHIDDSEILNIFAGHTEIRSLMEALYSTYVSEDIRDIFRQYLGPTLAQRLGVEKVTIDWTS